jgi:hypothetical protein
MEYLFDPLIERHQRAQAEDHHRDDKDPKIELQPELGTVERAMKRVKHGRYGVDACWTQHARAFQPFLCRAVEAYLIEFMQTLGTPLQAAAE